MSKKRGLLVWSLLGLATILLFVSSLTVWSKRQLLDDQAWANSSTQLLANDEVARLRRSSATHSSSGSTWKPSCASGCRRRGRELPSHWRRRSRTRSCPRPPTGCWQRPRVQTLWENLNKRAHAGVLKVPEGKDLGQEETSRPRTERSP